MSDTTIEPDETQDVGEPNTPVDDYAEQLLAEAVESEPKPEPVKNVWDSPDDAKAEIEKLRRENAKDRTTAKENAAKEARQALLKQLGLVQDDKPADPAELAKSLQAKESEAKSARVELAIFKNAGAAGADPAALLDSSSFLAKANDLDFSDTEAVTAAIRAAVESNPRLSASKPGERLPSYTPAGEGDTHVSSKPSQYTRQDLARMTPEQITKAKADGQLDDVLTGKTR